MSEIDAVVATFEERIGSLPGRMARIEEMAQELNAKSAAPRASPEGQDINEKDLVVSKPAAEFGACAIFPFPFFAGDALCVVLPDVATILLQHPKWWDKASDPPPDTTAFCVATLPVKGMSMLAANDINPGTLIVQERPLFFHQSAMPSDEDAALRFLREDRRKGLYSLYNGTRGIVDDTELSQISATNAVGVNLPDFENDFHCVCQFISRANHDCTPNATWHWDFDAFRVGLTATHFIPAGSKITISYVPILRPAAERKADLESTFNSVCECHACNLSSPTYALSEERRTTLQQLWPNAKNATAIVKRGGCDEEYVQNLLQLLDDDGLQGHRGILLADAAVVENHYKHEERAKGYARRAMDELLKFEGVDGSWYWRKIRKVLGDEVEDLLEYVDLPKLAPM